MITNGLGSGLGNGLTSAFGAWATPTVDLHGKLQQAATFHSGSEAHQFAFGDAIWVAGALRVTDARIREQARKGTIGCVLNIAEGAGRRSRADKSRVYAIALGELCEAAAAVASSALHSELATALRRGRYCTWLCG